MMFFRQYRGCLSAGPSFYFALLLALSHCGLKWGEPAPPASPYLQPSVGGPCENLDYKAAFVSYFAPAASSSEPAGKSLSLALNCLSKITNESQAEFANESLNKGELIRLLKQDFVRTKATAPIVDHILSSEYNYLDPYIEIKNSLITMIQASAEGRALAEGAVCSANMQNPSGTVFSKTEARVFASFLEKLAGLATQIEEQADHLFQRLQGDDTQAPLSLSLLNDESLRQKLLSEIIAIFKSNRPLSAQFFEEGFSSPEASRDSESERLFRSLSQMAALSLSSANRLDRQSIKYILLNIYITSALFPLYDRDGDWALSSEELQPLTCWTKQVVSLIVSPRLKDLPYIFHGLLNPQLVSDYILSRQKLPFLEDGSVNWDYVSFFLSNDPRENKSLSYTGMSSLISKLFVSAFFFHKENPALENMSKSAGILSSGSGLLAQLRKWFRSPENWGGSSVPSPSEEQNLSALAGGAAGSSSDSASSRDQDSSIDSALSNMSQPAGTVEQEIMDFTLTVESLQGLWKKTNFPSLSQSAAQQMVSLKDILFYILERAEAKQDLSGLCKPGPLPAPSSYEAELSFRFARASIDFIAEVQTSGIGFSESFLADPEVQALLGSHAEPSLSSQAVWDSPAFQRLFVLKLALWFEERFPAYSLFLSENIQDMSPVEGERQGAGGAAQGAGGVAQGAGGVAAATQAFFVGQIMASLGLLAPGGRLSSLQEFESSRGHIFLHPYIIRLVFSLYDRDGDFSLSPEESESLACLPARVLEVSAEPFLQDYNPLVRDFFTPLAVSRYFIAHQKIPFWDGQKFPSFQKQDLRFVGWRGLEGSLVEGHLSYGEVSRQLTELGSLGLYIARQAVAASSAQPTDESADTARAFSPISGETALEGLPRFYTWLIGLFKADPDSASAGATGFSSLTKRDVEEFAETAKLVLPESTDDYFLILKDIMPIAGLYRGGWALSPENVESICSNRIADKPLAPDFEVFSSSDSLTLKQILEDWGQMISTAEQDSRILFSLLQEKAGHDKLSKQDLIHDSGSALRIRFMQVFVPYFEQAFPEQARLWQNILSDSFFPATENPADSFFEEGESATQSDGKIPILSRFLDFIDSVPPIDQTPAPAQEEHAILDELPDNWAMDFPSSLADQTQLALHQDKARVLWELMRGPFKEDDRLSAQNIRSFVLNVYTAQALFDAWDYNGDLHLSSEELRPLACLMRRSLDLALRPLLTKAPLLEIFYLPQALTAYVLRHQNVSLFSHLIDEGLQVLRSPLWRSFFTWFWHESKQDRAWLFDPQNAANFEPSFDVFSQVLPKPGRGFLPPVSQDPFRLSAGELSVLTALIYSEAYDVLQDLLYGKAISGKTQQEREDYSLLNSLPNGMKQLLSWESSLSWDELAAWGGQVLRQAFAHTGNANLLPEESLSSDKEAFSAPGPLGENLSPWGEALIPCFDPECLSVEQNTGLHSLITPAREGGDSQENSSASTRNRRGQPLEQESQRRGPAPDSFLYPPQR